MSNQIKFIEPEWPAPQQIKAYTTCRLGWGDFEKTQHLFHTATTKEEQALMQLLTLPKSPGWLVQTHSTKVIEVLPHHTVAEADASYSNQAGQVCIVLTADCLPLLICNQTGTQVAAIHAGWRGLAAGIVEKTIAQLNQPADRLLVWLGPAIGPDKFEVGPDVFAAFVDKHAHAETAFKALKNEKWLADLYQLARLRLKEVGVSQIYGGNFCTFSDPDLFFSYRRDNKKTGRMASLIWIDDK